MIARGRLFIAWKHFNIKYKCQGKSKMTSDFGTKNFFILFFFPETDEMFF